MLEKHRQLAPTVRQIADDLVMNLMENSDLASMLEKGATFIFGSWFCEVDGVSVFNSHLAKST